MFEIKKLNDRYLNDAFFNHLVNLLKTIIEQYGFQADELRQAIFLAQFRSQMSHADTIIKTQKEWEQVALAREIMQSAILKVQDLNTLKGSSDE